MIELVALGLGVFVAGFGVGWTMAVGGRRRRRRPVGMIDLQRGRR